MKVLLECLLFDFYYASSLVSLLIGEFREKMRIHIKKGRKKIGGAVLDILFYLHFTSPVSEITMGTL